MAIYTGDAVRMAYLATYGGSHVNGVAELHSQLLKDVTLKNFSDVYPAKFKNVTNGVTPRRFIKLANPRLSELITEGLGTDKWLEDLDLLEELSRTITETALCGLGQAACNPVVSTLKYFRKEYLAHVVDHHCPICNGRKRRLVIKPELCKGCGKCKRNCPMEAISGEIRMPHTIDNDKCIHCGACWGACPFGAIDAIEEE